MIYFLALAFGFAAIFCWTIVLRVWSRIVAKGSEAKAGFERIAGIRSASSVLWQPYVSVSVLRDLYEIESNLQYSLSLLRSELLLPLPTLYILLDRY